MDPDLRMVLNKIYGLPASVSVITQVHGWKYGKTDFAFLLTEMLKELDLIDEFSSNTETYGENKIAFINDFIGYDRWLIHNKRRKLFIYDEIIESSQRRRAMSSANISWVKRIPQLSKGRCHLVAVTQSPRLSESTFFNWTFLRGIWTKINKTTVEFSNPQWFDTKYVFYDIPKTNIEFDQYQIATFMDRGGATTENFNFPIYYKVKSGLKDMDIAREQEWFIEGTTTPDHKKVRRELLKEMDIMVGLLSGIGHSYPLVDEQSPNAQINA